MGCGPQTEHLGKQIQDETAVNAVEFFKGFARAALQCGGVDGFRTEEEASGVIKDLEEGMKKEPIWEELVTLVGRKPL